MNAHTHKHEHCKHERMKFCLHCNTPYCLDCGEEWNKERIVYQFAPPIYTTPIYQPPYTWPTIICGTTGGTASTELADRVSSTVLITQCSHLEQ